MRQFEIQHTDGHWSIIEGLDECDAIASIPDAELCTLKIETIRPCIPKIVKYVATHDAICEYYDNGQKIEIISNCPDPAKLKEIAALFNSNL